MKDRSRRAAARGNGWEQGPRWPRRQGASKTTIYERVGKRVLDLIIACCGLLILSPIFLVAAVLIVIDDGFPSLFRQRRVGTNTTPFTLLKLRTMRRGTPQTVSTKADPTMVTRVGRILRRTNLDEIPQFFNVLRGEMSIVGPRPALPGQDSLMALRTASGASRCRPGLTGLAQVNSYDGMPEEEKARFDTEYCTRVTFRSDLAILVRTVAYLLRRPPVY